MARAHAQGADASQEEQIPSRPAVLFNRWEEDWSVLADPRVPREPFDELKYIALSSTDPLVYLSLGADYRSRFEANDAPAFHDFAVLAQFFYRCSDFHFLFVKSLQC